MDRWTIKELNSLDDFSFAQSVLLERAMKISPYSPLGVKLKDAAHQCGEIGRYMENNSSILWAEPARMMEVCQNALSYLADGEGSTDLYKVLSVDLQMTDKEIIDAGFEQCRVFMKEEAEE